MQLCVTMLVSLSVRRSIYFGHENYTFLQLITLIIDQKVKLLTQYCIKRFHSQPEMTFLPGLLKATEKVEMTVVKASPV